MKIPKNHPRKTSLELRHRLTDGLEKGIVASAGLIAHGRGEAFDYLLGEKTSKQAKKAEKAAAAALLEAEKPVVTVNGNVAAICPREVVKLAEAVGAKIEINLFYRTKRREKLIRDALLKAGAGEVYGVGVNRRTIPRLKSERAKADKPTLEADTVLIMLEDGDRTEHLVNMGKTVIAVDLNPLSRTARKAHITVVDNVVRALPNITSYVEALRGRRAETEAAVKTFNQKRNLEVMEQLIRRGL